MVLNSKIECRPSAIAGMGLYAIAPIAKGEMIWEPEPNEKDTWYKIDVVRSWPRDVPIWIVFTHTMSARAVQVQEYFLNVAYQVAADTFSGLLPGQPSDKAEFTNHSCEPTTRFEGDERTIATRDIAVGEEITYDYGTSETRMTTHPPFKCACGTAACRGIVTGFDTLLPEVQAKYAGQFTESALAFQAAWKAEHGDNAVPAARRAIADLRAQLDAGVRLQSEIEKLLFGDTAAAASH